MNLEKPKKEDKVLKHKENDSSKENGSISDPQKQINLAEELYKTLLDEHVDIKKVEEGNKVMQLWTKETKDSDGNVIEKSFSQCYREIRNDPKFAEHPRFKDGFHKITIDDVLYYKEHNRLPEN